MSESTKKGDIEPLDEVVLSQVYLLEAVVSLLEEKGMVTRSEITERVSELKSKRSA